jgi:hypothetical protein
MSTKTQEQRTWTRDEVERRLKAGETLNRSDRVLVDGTNMSVMSYLRVYVVPLALTAIRHERGVSYDEARRIFRNGPIGQILYGN